MKSRTSFFNPTVYRKNLTRFAPSWVIYTVILLLGYAVLMSESPYWRARNLAELIAITGIANFIYAFLNAQLIFGDLFSSRMCNALHAMPLRRECWYTTNLASGLTFCLIPEILLTFLGVTTMGLGKAWALPLLWMLASTLQYVCFFGIAVLCINLTGNRFASGVVCGLVNFFSMLIYWLVTSLYEPLLTGIKVRQDPFVNFSPLVKLCNEVDLVEVLSIQVLDQYGGVIGRTVTGLSLTGAWVWLYLYGAVGIAALVLGLFLYRRRALECAGDFMAFRSGEPVLLIVYTVTVAGIFHLFSDLFDGGPLTYLFLLAGLAVGYFTGLMLLQRTVRVFRLKTVACFAIFAAALIASLGLTALDPLGLTRWVPDADKVASINLSNRYTHYSYSERELELTDPEDIQNILDAHSYVIGRTAQDEIDEFGRNYTVNLCVEYTLKNGRTVTRFYDLNTCNEAGQILQPYFSSFEYVTGFTEDQIPDLASRVTRIWANTNTYDKEEEYPSAQDAEELLRAIAADCAGGNMAQFGAYHLVKDEFGELDWEWGGGLEIGYLQIDDNTNTQQNLYFFITVYSDSVHTIQWLEDHGLYAKDLTDLYY